MTVSASSRFDMDSAKFTISIDGDFTFAETTEFIRLYSNVPDGAQACEIDFGRVEYMDSSALGVLLLMKTEIESKGVKEISLTNCASQILDILTVCQYQEMFSINP